VMRYVEKSILLQTLDHLWREHLVMLEHLRQVIGLRGYGQRDPLNEYKAESFNLFEAMSANLREAVTSQLMRVEIRAAPPPKNRRTCLTWRRTKSTPRPARTSSPLHVPGRRPSRATGSPPAQRRLSATRTILQAGARLAATRPVPAVRARNTSTATGGSLKPTIDDRRWRMGRQSRVTVSSRSRSDSRSR